MNYEVIIVDNPTFLRKELYLVKKENGVVVQVAEPLEIVMSDRKPGTESKPTFIFDEWGGENIISAFERAFTKKVEPKLGEIEATKRHLQDMKTIAFHKLGIEEQK